MVIPSLQFPGASAASLAPDLRRLEDRQSDLQLSLASGVRSNSYAGLGGDRQQVLDLTPAISGLRAWQQNVSAAQTTLSTSQAAMSRITALATNIGTTLVGLEGRSDPASITAAVTQARTSLRELADLVNTRNGTDYIFAGTDADQAPVSSPDRIGDGSLATAAAAAIGGLAATDVATVRAAIVAAAGDNAAGRSPFSAALSAGPAAAAAQTRIVPVNAGVSVAAGYVATQGDAAPSSTSTGSPLRDLFGLLSAVSGLGATNPAGPDFAALASNLANWSSDIGANLTGITAGLGASQATLTRQSEILSRTDSALAAQLGTARDSDAASLSIQISTVQSQLTASYTLVANSGKLSLASFL